MFEADSQKFQPGFEVMSSHEEPENVSLQVDQGDSTEVEMAARRKMRHVIGQLDS